MSVLPCARNGCKNVMCDRYSSIWGYICDECFDELLKIKGSISEFMESEKREPSFEKFCENYYNKEFKRID